MALEKSGIGTSKKIVDQPNDTKKTGRSDGTEGTQLKLGSRQGKGDLNAERLTRPFDGFDFAGRLGLQDGKLTEADIVTANVKGDRVGGQPIEEK